jgi:hypothetical protein
MDVFRVALPGSAFRVVIPGLVEIRSAPAQPIGSPRAVIILIPVVGGGHDVFNAATSVRRTAALAAWAASAPAGALRPRRPFRRKAAVMG